MSVNMEDFRVNGSIDWKAYSDAQVAAGDICRQCRSYLFSGRGPQLCHYCESLLSDKGSVSHKNLVRCPNCTATFKAFNEDNYEVFQEGGHEVTCYRCEHDFEIETHVTYSFTSPATLKVPPDEGQEKPVEEIPPAGGKDAPPGKGK